ncbi:thiopurine S-methyltransferase [Pseudoalteromonas luteoviolacea]|uniref:thiopurine S-methyltransferase n=1 Tax=Pseudoalteromonas luteoviolacea TaxID=43657 RepID=UPI001153C6F3|nr:thiopurine S-methyltransferase [Pseudoalteromonas luteoviolacea]TQF67573.1 thiopurine S-methyltransferase [Pseudoalteromonas luteoviolacea]
MKASFWFDKWQSREIAFHEGRVNQLLERHVEALNLERGAHIFVPLCGKTRDIAWLLQWGYRVTGAELSKVAVEELFNELGVEPKIKKIDKFEVYTYHDLTVYVGDFFEMTSELLQKVDAIYDRAAFIAMPDAMLTGYCDVLKEITKKAPQLLIGYLYDQNLVAGPPFALSQSRLNTYYGQDYKITQLETIDSNENMKGIAPAQEACWLLCS